MKNHDKDDLRISDFDAFFIALHGHESFKWQKALLKRVYDEGWPALLDLPTASGKTACIDIAIFALALQAGRPWQERTTPLRMFFVVDRRIVVDEAYTRAMKIADRLRQANRRGENEVVKAVASRLKEISHTDRALAVARLRGGTVPDDGWADIPSQPAVITGTVDQVGSRLLFRSYGCSLQMASVYAGLVAYDSLILLDEAHCSQPFLQTISAVRDYVTQSKWRHGDAVAKPLSVMMMSATPPEGVEPRFPANEKERKEFLSDPVLMARQQAEKPTLLELVTGKAKAGAALTQHAGELAAAWARQGRRRIGVMVNRVAFATAIAARLREEMKETADVVLLTGRMRPIDRDKTVKAWEEVLKSGSDRVPEKPVIVVTTQCLEVGADFDFDSLITQCASIDALQQRFGRLDRLGKLRCTPLHKAQAAILMQEGDVKEADDPIYGSAMAATWKWLNQHAKDGAIHMGVEAMGRQLPHGQELASLLGPREEAPTLMPAHVDLLCQTSPPPATDPDVSVFLHGLKRGQPQVRIALRADLPMNLDARNKAACQEWADMIELCPPATGECLNVSLRNLRRYLSQRLPLPEEDVEDVALTPLENAEEPYPSRTFFLWREGKAMASADADKIRSTDTVIIPVAPSLSNETAHQELLDALGTFPAGSPLDQAEEAHRRAGRRCVLRVHPAILGRFKEHPAVASLLALGAKLFDKEIESEQVAQIEEALNAIAGANISEFPDAACLQQICKDLGSLKRSEIDFYPDHSESRSSFILHSRLKKARETITLTFDDEEDLLFSPLEENGTELASHLEQVSSVAVQLASAIPEYKALLQFAGEYHDIGKLDYRFQCLLNNSESLPPQPLAKSTRSISLKRQRLLHETLGLPAHFRHEALSSQLLQQVLSETPQSFDALHRELVIHLIDSHHGYARPFMPVCLDDQPPAVDATLKHRRFHLSSETRQAMPPAHRLDSGIAERFWRLNRLLGWWGLAYLEAMFRKADHYASAHAKDSKENV